ncbi:hypothetical protein diail_6877 [Diaporthe ilicicola]|nr:hypothetical protein diail_6877 [Diaporthe ilicicola]
MSANDRENSLEREFKNEDIAVAAGQRSKEKREKAREDKEREREEQKLADSKQMMLDAAGVQPL